MEEYWNGLPFPYPGESPNPGKSQPCISCIGRWILYHQTTGEAPPATVALLRIKSSSNRQGSGPKAAYDLVEDKDINWRREW